MRLQKMISGRFAWALWTLLLGFGLAWWTWKRADVPMLSVVQSEAPAFVQVAGSGEGVSDRVLREKAELFDPTPLFFPTEWNYAPSSPRLSIQRDPAQVFASIEPKFAFSDQNLKLVGAELAAPKEIGDVLAQGNPAPLSGFGQVAVARPLLTTRRVYIEVISFSDSLKVLTQSIAEINLPRTDFAPLEFLVLVGTGGLIGEPVLASGSGVEDVDAFFGEYLLKTFRLGERVNPGRYRVVVGP